MSAYTPRPEHRFSTLGRPLDPSWPTNRAVLWLMPVGALTAGLAAPFVPGLAGVGAVWSAASGAGVVLGAWALGRELAPDDQRAAFVAMALGFAALMAVPGTSLVLLFATLLTARLVNRTVGLPARALDGVAALLLVGWAVADTGSPLVGVVAAVAFAADALLPEGRRTQWGFAALCLIMVAALAGGLAQEPLGGSLLSRPIQLAVPEPRVLAGVGVVSALFVLALVRTRSLASRCDATGAPLSVTRVRWGMALTLLMGAQALFVGEGGAAASSFLWAGMAGVGLSRIAPPGSRPDGA